MDSDIQFLQKVIQVVEASNGALALRSISVEKHEFTTAVLLRNSRDLSAEEQDLARSNKIAAIKAYRERTETGLGESKKVVEEYLATVGLSGL